MEFKIPIQEMAEAMQRSIEESPLPLTVEEVGEVVEAGDGIARIAGLPIISFFILSPSCLPSLMIFSLSCSADLIFS